MASSLALLSGANPKTCAIGPKVRLQAGVYQIIIHGLKTSRLRLWMDLVDPSLNIQHELEFEVLAPTIVQVMFENRGEESHLSVYAKRVA